MKNLISALSFALTFTLMACSTTPAEDKPSAQSMLEERADTKPSPAVPSPIAAPKTVRSERVTTPVQPAPVPTVPVQAAPGASETTGPVKAVTQIWKLKKGKLDGPFAFGHPTVLSKTKNKKGNGHTTETCFRYATYAVVELRSSDEVGSGELTIRHDPPKGFALCLAEFKGKTSSLRIIEGYFAGVAGGLIMIDGADSTEGQTEFQLFDAESSQEVLKSYHHPTEDFSIIKVADAVSVEFMGKMAVKCELANEGEKCWKKVLSDNKVIGKTPMPDCAGIFEKSKTALTEPALVFTRVRMNKLGSAPKFLGGKATCQPAP